MADKLRAYWGRLRGEKQKQLLFDGPARPDMRFLCYKVFTQEVLDELERRGYDISTLKFSIERKPDGRNEDPKTEGDSV